jgi:hypothetical protein
VRGKRGSGKEGDDWGKRQRGAKQGSVHSCVLHKR